MPSVLCYYAADQLQLVGAPGVRDIFRMEYNVYCTTKTFAGRAYWPTRRSICSLLVEVLSRCPMVNIYTPPLQISSLTGSHEGVLIAIWLRVPSTYSPEKVLHAIAAALEGYYRNA